MDVFFSSSARKLASYNTIPSTLCVRSGGISCFGVDASAPRRVPRYFLPPFPLAFPSRASMAMSTSSLFCTEYMVYVYVAPASARSVPAMR